MTPGQKGTRGRWRYTVPVLAALLALAACSGSAPTPAGSTEAGIEADIMASRPAAPGGLAPPIYVTTPTPSNTMPAR